MAEIKKIDTNIFNNNITSIANTIRNKTHEIAQINFPNGFLNKINNDFYLLEFLLNHRNINGIIYLNNINYLGAGVFANSNITEVYGPNITIFEENGAKTFYSCNNLITANFPKISIVGPYMFYSCDNLSNIFMPLVTEIKNYGFYYCEKLSNLNFPLTTKIGANAFQGCNSLTDISTAFPEVTYIGSEGFSRSTNLQKINFPKVTSMAYQAFFRCSSLIDINFPELTTITGYDAFGDCTSLVDISNAFPKLTDMNTSTFDNCSNLTTISFPSVKTITNYAFRNCISLQNISTAFPEVTSIGQWAFEGCSNLTTIYFPKTTLIKDVAFLNCTSLTNISNAFPEVTKLGENGTTNGSYGAFRGCTGLITVTFPKVTSIGRESFKNCTALTTVNFPKATEIKTYAFSNCTSLTNINIPKVTSIGVEAFSDCSSLTGDISSIFQNVTTLGTAAFSRCTNITKFFGKNIINSSTPFQHCTNLQTLIFPKITGNCGVFDCSNLNSLDIGQAVESIFVQGCTILNKIILRKTSSIVILETLSKISSTPFSENGLGGILYVPQNLIQSYQEGSNWSVLLSYPNNQILPIEGSQYENYYVDGTGLPQNITINIPQKNNKTPYFAYSNTETEIPYNDAYTTTIDFSPFNYNDLDISILMGETNITGTALTINNNIGTINIAHVTAPLTISIDLPEPDSNTQLFTEAALGLSQTRGSITVPETGWRTMTSTGSANWGITISYKGTATLFKQMNSMYGHTIRMDLDVEWLKEVSGAQFYVTPCGCTNITNTTPQRRGYESFSIPSGMNFKGTVLFKLPDNKDEWSSTTNNYPAGDNDYLSARFFLYSNNTGSVRINSVAFYDLGILEENE